MGMPNVCRKEYYIDNYFYNMGISIHWYMDYFHCKTLIANPKARPWLDHYYQPKLKVAYVAKMLFLFEIPGTASTRPTYFADLRLFGPSSSEVDFHGGCQYFKFFKN